MFESRPIIDTLPARGAEDVLIASDMHIGNEKSRYDVPWRRTCEALRDGCFTHFVINGDFTDRHPYLDDRAAAHTARLRRMLEEMLAIDPECQVTMLLGNHDLAAEYQAMLAGLAADYGERRFRVGEALLLGDETVFAHGDFNPRTPLDLAGLQEFETRSKQRQDQFGQRPHVEEVTLMLGKLRDYLGAARYDALEHVFFAHAHPQQPQLTEIVGDKQVHITGAPMTYCPSLITQARFEDGALSQLRKVYSEQSRGEGRWARRYDAPRRTDGELYRTGYSRDLPDAAGRSR